MQSKEAPRARARLAHALRFTPLDVLTQRHRANQHSAVANQLMASLKKARPRPALPSLNLTLQHLRARRKLLGVVLLALGAVLWLLRRSRAIVEDGGAMATRQLRFDREREEEGLVSFPALEELVNRDRMWPPDLDKPICTPKIYVSSLLGVDWLIQARLTLGLRTQVYTLPSDLTLPKSTVTQCRWSAYNSELLLHSLLTSPTSAASLAPHLTITEDPTEADLFFIPLFASCYSFNCWVKAGWKKTERCGVDEEYIQPVMRWVREQGFWDANGGADHIIPHPMDFGDGYYTETSRAAMNSSIYLVTVGDHRPPPFSSHFRPYRDLVIPSSTHLLNSYYINPMDYLDEQGHPLVTLRGAAHCTRPNRTPPSRSEIFEPTPPAPGVWGGGSLGKLKERLVGGGGGRGTTTRRTTTAIFRGGVGQPGEGEAYALSIRSLFFPSPSGNVSLPPFSSTIHPGFSSLPGYDIAPSSENEAYALALSRTKFGLAPPGYTLDTTRIYEYLAFGVVPVFIGSGTISGQVMPFQADFDYRRFSIAIPRERAHEVPGILTAVGEEEYERLREEVWKVGRLLVLEQGRGNVWKWLARGLCRMRGIGTGAGPEIANN